MGQDFYTSNQGQGQPIPLGQGAPLAFHFASRLRPRLGLERGPGSGPRLGGERGLSPDPRLGAGRGQTYTETGNGNGKRETGL